MKQFDRIMKDNVPGYGYMKKAMPQVGAGRERKNTGRRIRTWKINLKRNGNGT